jgi:hypothetical protein
VHIQHLDGGKFVQNSTRAQSWCQWTQPRPQGYVQAVGHEGDKDVGLDPVLELVKNGAQRQVVLQVLKGRFDFDQLDVKFPQLSWVTSTQIGAKQVATFPAAGDAQLLTIQGKAETRDSFCRGLWELDVD